MKLGIGKLFRILLNQRPPRVDNDFLKLIYSRKSCRKFTQQPVDKEQMDQILTAGILSPSTVNLQTWSFFPFTNGQWRDTFGASIPFGAQAAVIVVADLKRLELADPVFKEYPTVFYTLAVMNASLAAMNMTLAIEALGMKSIMLSQTGRTGLMDLSYLREKLSLPELCFPLMTVAFGYPEQEVLFSPPKLDKGIVVHDGRYHMDADGFKEWFADMELICQTVEKEKLTEKFHKYVQLLPNVEKELRDAVANIQN